MARPRDLTPLEDLAPIGEPRVEPSLDSLSDRRASAPLAIAILLACLVSAIAFAASAWRARLSAPYFDDHAWLLVALDHARALPGPELFRPHNGQRIVWARLLAWVSVRSGAESTAFIVSSLASTALLAGALASAALRGLPGRGLGLVLAGAAVLLTLDGASVQDAAWPVFSVYLHVAGFAAAALVAGEPRAGGRTSTVALALACAFGVGAVFGNAAGLTVWPVLVWRALTRSDRRALVVLGLGALAMLAFAGPGALIPQSHPEAAGGSAGPLKMLAYFGGFCALPWSGGRADPATELAGWIAALAGAWLALRPAARAGGLPGTGAALIGFGLIAAAMAAIGRVDELATPIVPTRYAPFAGMLHVGLMFAAAPELSRMWSARPRLAEAAAALLGLALVLQNVAIGAKWTRAATRINAASDAFDLGDRSPDTVALVYPDAAQAAAIRARLKSAR